MPNLDPWVNQNEEHMATNTINKFENHLLSVNTEHQKRIKPNSHPTYNERHEKIIEMLDWTLEKYKAAVANIKMTNQQNEHVIIDTIIEELDKKRDRAIHKKKKAILKDEVSIYRFEENTIDYVLFRIRELKGKYY